MNWEDERAAFENRVSANYSTTPVMYPGIKKDPPNKAPWVKMELLPSAATRITLGPNARHREYGMLLLMIFVPLGEGTVTARTIADELSAIFHEARFSHANSGLIRMKTPLVTVRGATPEGLWYQLNLTIEYERDVTVA